MRRFSLSYLKLLFRVRFLKDINALQKLNGWHETMRRYSLSYLRLFFRAFLLKDMEAMHSLGAWHGSLGIKGIDRMTSYRKAHYFYRKAASKGHAESQYDLALMILDGEIEGHDKLEGVKWLELSAKSGFEPAIGLYDVYKDCDQSSSSSGAGSSSETG
jgi:TPR repeat protein